MRPDLTGYLSALAEDPENSSAIEAIRALGPGLADPQVAFALAEARRAHAERGDTGLCLRLIELEMEQAENPAHRATMLVERATLLLEGLLDEPAATAALTDALRLRPGDPVATDALSRIQMVAENRDRIIARYLEEAETATDKALQTGLYQSAAEMHARRDPDSVEAERLLKRALEVAPRNHPAERHLERMLRRRSRWDDLLALYERRAEVAATREERATALAAAANLVAGAMAEPELAEEYFKKVLAIDPAAPRALAALADRYTAAANWTGLLQIYESALHVKRVGAAGPAMLLQVAMLAWKKVGDRDAAERHFREIKKTDPGHPALVDFYREYHGNKGDPQKLLQTLEQALRLQTDPARKIEIAIDLARVAEEEVGNFDKAIEAWKGVLRLVPGKPDAAESLMRLYRKAEKWNALREMLKQQIDALPADALDEKIARYLEMAAIYRDHLKLDVMVVSTYNAILQLRPDDKGALDALAERYEAMGRYSDLVNLLTRQAQIEPNPTQRIDVHRRIARLWIDRFGNHGQATRPLEEILAIDPLDPEALAALREIHEKRHNWRGLYDLGLREVERLEGRERRKRLGDVARIAVERLGDVRGAIGLWNQALEQHADDAEALEELAALYERDKRWPAVAEIRRRQREITKGADRLPILEKLAAVWTERLRQPARAVATWREVLDLRPDHAKALRTLTDLYVDAGEPDALEEIYARRGAWSELCEALTQASDRVLDRAAKLGLLERVAALALDPERLDRPEAAIRAYERILGVDPENVRAARALAPIYLSAGDHERLLGVYEVLLSGSEAREEKLDLLEKIRVLCEVKLGSAPQAFEWSARAFSLAPADEMLRGEVERLAEAAGAWQELVDVYVGQLPEVPEGAARTAIQRTIADTMRVRLRNGAEARQFYEAVALALPEDLAALTALEEITAATQDWAALAEIIRRMANLEPDSRRRAEMLNRRAQLQSDKLEDIEAAGTTYEELLYLDPSSVGALRALERIRRKQNRWPDVRDCLERQVECVQDISERVDAWYALGEVWDAELGDPARAIGVWAQALGADVRHRPSLTALERYLLPESTRRTEVARLLVPVYEKIGANWELATALEIELESASGDERLALLERLARVYSDRLKDARGAYRARGRIFELSPDDVANRAALALRSADAGETEDLAERYQAVLAGVQGALRRDLAMELGAIEEERLVRPDRALVAYRLAIEADPGHDGVFEALHRVLTNTERFGDLRDLLFARVEHLSTVEARRELFYEAAELCDQVIGDQDGAARAWENILELEPTATRAYRALVAYYTRRQRWQDLDGIYGRHISNTEEAEEIRELKFLQAKVQLDNLGQASSAADLLEDIVEGPPLHEPALELLELMRVHDQVGVRVSQFLEPLHERLGEYAKLVEDLDLQRDVQGDRAVDFQLTSRIAEVQERRLKDVPAAFTSWRRAMMLDPRDPEPRKAVDRLQAALGDWPTVVQTWTEVFERAPGDDLGLRADLATRAARIVEDRLSDVDGARVAWRRVLDVDPDGPQIAVPAATALARLAERAGRFEELIEALRMLVHFADASPARVELLARIARVHEEALGQTDLAIAAWREVLEIRPDGRDALDSLERLFVGAARWQEVAEVVRRRIDLCAEPRERRDLRMRLGLLLEEMLGEADEATRAYGAALDEVPGDPAALEALARLHEAAQRWPQLLQVLEQQLAGAATPAARVALLVRTGALLQDQLHDVGGALERYREAINLDASTREARTRLEALLRDDAYALRAAAVLEPVARSERAFDRLVVIHEIQVRAASSPVERIELLRRIAALYEQDYGNPTAAFEAIIRAVRDARSEAGPLLGDALKELRRLADALGLHAEEAATLQDIAPDLVDPEQRLLVTLRVAEVARQHLAERVLARDWYRRVLDTVPEHLEALEALEAIHREGREWDPLLEICERRAELASADADLRVGYLAKMGEICEAELGRPEEAIAAQERILALRPADAMAVSALDRLYSRVERWPDLVRLLWSRVERATDPDEPIALRMRIAGLHATRLGDRTGALALYKGVLADRPGHDGAVAALEGMLDDAELRASAGDALEPVYVGREDWKGLVRVYEIRRDHTTDRRIRRQIGARIARLSEEQLLDRDAAFVWYGQLWREDPSDTEARDELVRLADALGRHGEAVALLVDYLDEATSEDGLTLEVARRAAEILDEKLGDVDRARDNYLRVLRADWHDDRSLGDMERCLARHSRWADLADVYREASANTFEPPERRALLVKLASLVEERLGDPGGAVPVWREVLDLYELDRAAIDSLDRLYSQLGRDADLVELLVRQVETADPSTRIRLKARLGPLYERLYDFGSAIDCYEDVLGMTPDDSDALAALERQLASGEHRLRVARFLGPVYERKGEFAKLIGVQETRLEFESDRPARAAILEEIARIDEARRQPGAAFDALVRGIREEPARRSILDALERIGQSLGRHAEVVRVLSSAAEEIYDAALASDIHGRIATLAEQHLGDPTLAIDAWKKRLLHDAGDERALDALDRLLGEVRRFEEQVEVLERKVQGRQDQGGRADLLRRIAHVQEVELGRQDQAVQTWKSLLGFDESDRGALDALERLYRATAQWIELVWVYQRKIEFAAQPGEARDLRTAVARVYVEKIADAFEAIGAYKAVLEIAPDDAEALGELDRLCESEQLWSDLLEVLEAEARLATGVEDRDGFEIRAARLLLGALEDPHRAIGKLASILERTPAHVEARTALEDLSRRDDTRRAAAEVLDPAYRRVGAWAAVVDLIELCLGDEVDPTRREERLREVARVREEQLGDRAGALDAYARALAEDPGDEQVAEHLERLAGLEGQWLRVATVYAEQADRALDGELVFRYAMRLGRVQDDALGDDEAAAAAYRRALQVGLSDAAALQALDRVYERAARWTDLAEVLEREARTARQPSERVDFLLRLGLVREQELGDLEGALLAFRTALAEEAGSPSALEALERLLGHDDLRAQVLDVLEPAYETLGRPQKQLELMKVRLELSRDARERSRLLGRIASLEEDKLGEHDAALHSRSRALEEWPEDQAGLEHIKRLADRTQRWGEAAARLRGVLDRGVTADSARAIGLLRARWLHERMGDAVGAEAALRAVLEFEPTCAEALDRLETLARASQEASRIVEVLDRRLEHEHGQERRHPLLREAAGLRETALGDPEGAMTHWRGVLDLDGRDAEAHAALVRLLEGVGRDAELGQALLDQSSLLDEEVERVPYKRRSAQAFLRAGDLERASDVHRDILDHDPSDAEALQALEDIYGKKGDHASVKEILVRRIETLPAGPARAPVLAKLGRIAEEQGLSDEAAQWYEQLREVAPAGEGGLDRLEELYEADHKWFDLITILRERAEISLAHGDTQAEIAQLRRAAELFEDKLGDTQQAAHMLERVLARDPENVAALAKLSRLHEMSGQWDACLEVLGRALGLAGTRPEAAELHFHMGRVRAEGLGDPVGAEAHYARALEVDPGHAGAVEALLKAASRRGDHARVAALLEQREGRTTDTKARLEMLREIIALYTDKLGVPEAAVPALEKAAELAPDDGSLARKLGDLHFDAGRIDEAAARYERVVELSAGRRPKDNATIMRRLATIREQQGDRREALRWYEESQHLDATDGPTLAALGRIYLEREEWEKARRIFRAILLGNLDQAAGMRKGEVYYNLGRIHAHLGETAKALGMYERGLEIEPDSVRLRKAMEALRGGRS